MQNLQAKGKIVAGNADEDTITLRIPSEVFNLGFVRMSSEVDLVFKKDIKGAEQKKLPLMYHDP